MLTLFVFGTLTNPLVRKALFGEEIFSQTAVLKDYQKYLADDGYLFIKKATGELVEGQLIRLSTAQQQIADAWEDVPLYQLIPVEVNIVKRGSIEAKTATSTMALTYTRLESVNGTLARRESFSVHALECVLADIARRKDKMGLSNCKN